MNEEQPTFHEKIAQSAEHLDQVLKDYQPHYIVSMISGGKDSAASQALAEHLGVKIDLILHGNTRTGIPETNQFVEEYYGNRGYNFAVADAGSNYEDYVLRRGFFGKGFQAHMFSYHILKSDPFRQAISKTLRKRKKNIRILFINGARMYESENRQKRMKMVKPDPAMKNNIWFNIIHEWTKEDRDKFLDWMETPINPVAKNLCRSGECMCGTMQSHAERVEASCLYPEWGQWLDDIEERVFKKHGWKWGEGKADQRSPHEQPIPEDMFQPMCSDCIDGTNSDE